MGLMIPEFKILADDKDVTAQLKDRLLSLSVTDNAGFQSDALSIELDDRDNLIEMPRHGVKLEVFVGYEGSPMASLGIYTVDEVTLSAAPDKLSVSAKTADMRQSLKAQKSRDHHQIKLGDLVRQIAAEHGLEAKVAERFESLEIEHIDQSGESDLHLLTRLAKTHNAVSKPVSGYLVFVEKGKAKSASGKTLDSRNISKKDVSSIRLGFSDRNKYASVLANWKDTAAGESHQVVIGEGEPSATLPFTYGNEIEARAAAQASYDAFGRDTAKGSLTLSPGNPDLHAEEKLKLEGFREGINGEWIASRVSHRLNSSGLVTNVDFEIPPEENTDS